MSLTREQLRDFLADARRVALLAWSRIADYHRGDYDIHHKADGPATDADRLADKVIVETLLERYPRERFGYLSEEFENDPARLACDCVWTIDPIDGTEDFINGGTDFAVHVGLSARDHAGAPWHAVVGVVYHPLAGVLYEAARGCGAHALALADPARHADVEPELKPATPLRVSTNTDVAASRAVVSRSHMTRRLTAALAHVVPAHVARRGSLGVKIMEVATGRADFYLHTERGKCREWDLCAPQVILEEAGGRVTSLDGAAITYNHADVRLAAGVVATNGAIHDALMARLGDVPILYS